MTIASLILSFIFGLIVGSFINVFILRYHTGVSLRGRSFCFSCGHALSWYELIPLISFIFQKGCCRTCRIPISWRYPVTELIAGLLFVAIFWKLGYVVSPGEGVINFQFSIFSIFLLLFYAVIFSLLLTIALYDIRHKIIPNALVYLFIVLSFLHIFLINNSESITHHLFFGPLVALPFAALWLFSKGTWIGLGDAKLALGIGWFLGFSFGASAIIIAFWIGAAAGLALILFSHIEMGARYLFRFPKRITIKSEIPFAPFLIIGTAFVFFYDISFTDILSLFMS